MEYYRAAYPDTFRPHEQQAEREAGQVFRVAFMARSRLRAIVNVQDVLEVRLAGAEVGLAGRAVWGGVGCGPRGKDNSRCSTAHLALPLPGG